MPESNNKEPESETNLEWMIRPCGMYKEEYNDCKCMKARFHQYYIFGEFLDCTQWKIDYDNCYLWQKYKNKEALDELIKSEKTRRMERLRNHYNNNVWERRDKPPENWDAPLPDWLQEKHKNSYLHHAKKKLERELENRQEYDNNSSSCILM